jgi:flagellin-like hook-associated protein FlgL
MSEIFADTRTNFTGKLEISDSFSDPSYFLGSFTSGDVNSDGNLDLMGTSGNGFTLLLLGNGEGQFSFGSTVDTAGNGNTGSPILVDLNGDDILDLIQPVFNTDDISISIGNGNGSFQAPTAIDHDMQLGQNVTAADLNGDGYIDIAAGSATDGTLNLYFNDGAGNFTLSRTLGLESSTPQGGRAIVGDIDGDGNVDLVYATQTNIFSFLGDGVGNFTLSQTIDIGSGTLLANQLIDLTGDGALDLVVSNSVAARTEILVNDGSGSFTHTAALGSFGIVDFGDINNDGILDYVGLRNVGDHNGTEGVMLGNGDGTFTQSATILKTNDNSRKDSYFIDINSDGNLDVVIADSVNKQVWLYLGDGTGAITFSQTLSLGSGTTVTNSISSLRADVNGDGIEELIVVNRDPGNDTLSVLEPEVVTETYLPEINLSSQEKAQEMLSLFDTALDRLNERRANLGAASNRLEIAASSASRVSSNLQEARSFTLDTNYAEETAELVRQQIVQQAQIGALSQANAQMSLVLELLKDQ